MIFSFIIKVILSLAGVLLLCIAFISKLNRTAGQEDQQQYDKNFDPNRSLSFYADNKNQRQAEFNESEIKFYKS